MGEGFETGWPLYSRLQFLTWGLYHKETQNFGNPDLLLESRDLVRGQQRVEARIPADEMRKTSSKRFPAKRPSLGFRI